LRHQPLGTLKRVVHSSECMHRPVVSVWVVPG
jgi:hypothetical protein